MPRLSAEALVAPVVDVRRNRIVPPPNLEPDVAKIYQAVVNAVDAGHFCEGDSTLLTEYARAVAQAGRAARELALHGAVVDNKMSAWIGVQEKAWRAMAALSVRLRLGPQSRFDRQQAGRNARESGPRDYSVLYGDQS